MSTRSAHVVLAVLLVALLFKGVQGQEKKSPTLDDDLKALQGTWRHMENEVKSEFVVRKLEDENHYEFRFGGLSGQGVFKLQEKDKKRYIAVGFDKSSVVPAWRYRLDGDKLTLTSVDDKEKLAEITLTRAKDKK